MSSALSELVRRQPQRLLADASRVVTQLFVPGDEGYDLQESRSAAVLHRVLALGDDEVQSAFDDVVTRFSGRHHDLLETFGRHADELTDRLDAPLELSDTRRLLLGATFTSEYAIEGAALCNPSLVVHPDQRGVAPGARRVVMSVRGIGEGHRSSIGFRTGVVDGSGSLTFDPGPKFATTGRRDEAAQHATVFRGELRRLRGGGGDADFVLNALAPQFSVIELERRLTKLDRQLATRPQGPRIASLIRRIAERTYAMEFDEASALNERVLMPSMAAESQGMEDARFVRFTGEDTGAGADPCTYYATYTAYDGTDIAQQLLETTDFVRFTSSPLVGPAAANKGLALFPRRIDGRFCALSRSDRESNAIAMSDDLHHWTDATACQVPSRAWEVLQLGNCGSPIETDEGWLVLTHGVGPMRTYNIGALLLDLEDPTRILGQLARPLLTPAADEQDGYVPNVVYSCGALVHGGNLVLPYGIGDSAIGVATVPLAALLAALEPTTTSRPTITKESDMPEKSPQKPAGKKPGKSLKEKREAKRDKKESRSGLGR
jgi:predicted GH43/DUF377 family glycosyl hydrolase